jgi:hypothetical protein
MAWHRGSGSVAREEDMLVRIFLVWAKILAVTVPDGNEQKVKTIRITLRQLRTHRLL